MKGNPRKWWFHNVSFHTCYNPHILFARLTRHDFSKFGHTATYPIWPWLIIVLIRFAGSGDDLMHLRSSHCELYPLQDDMIWAWRSMARWRIWCEITMMSCMSPWKTAQLIHKTFCRAHCHLIARCSVVGHRPVPCCCLYPTLGVWIVIVGLPCLTFFWLNLNSPKMKHD